MRPRLPAAHRVGNPEGHTALEHITPHRQLRVLLAQPRQLRALALAQLPVPALPAAPVSLCPVPQGPRVDPHYLKLSGDCPPRPPRARWLARSGCWNWLSAGSSITSIKWRSHAGSAGGAARVRGGVVDGPGRRRCPGHTGREVPGLPDRYRALAEHRAGVCARSEGLLGVPGLPWPGLAGGAAGGHRRLRCLAAAAPGGPRRRHGGAAVRRGTRGGLDGEPETVGPGSVLPAPGPPRRGRGRVAGHLAAAGPPPRSEEHTSELQSQSNLVCRLLLEKKKKKEYKQKNKKKKNIRKIR